VAKVWQSLADTTRRVMRSLVSNQLALQLNFKGRGRNIGFGNTWLSVSSLSVNVLI